MHKLNSPDGKRLLSLVREGDYAHAGEIEAIEGLLKLIDPPSPRSWLDAGCGRGGTAAYIQRKCGVAMTAFDIDEVSLDEARLHYPQIRFLGSDVAQIAHTLSDSFDVISCFNSFYAFPNQPQALAGLARLAHDQTQLLIFEYTASDQFKTSGFAHLPETSHWKPVVPDTFPRELDRQGWRLEQSVNLDAEYARWYAELVTKFNRRKTLLVGTCGKEIYEYALCFYSSLLSAIESGQIGGALFKARKKRAGD
ncbi:MAG: class I SAM-dependent methyltransferase [Verrucomicrobiae bacterium]|nr:class I SAM-dependent methyltransferase [Verrucomicrobiae bacterium]